jgi:(2Fe-2S) ferredoxin
MIINNLKSLEVLGTNWVEQKILPKELNLAACVTVFQRVVENLITGNYKILDNKDFYLASNWKYYSRFKKQDRVVKVENPTGAFVVQFNDMLINSITGKTDFKIIFQPKRLHDVHIFKTEKGFKGLIDGSINPWELNKMIADPEQQYVGLDRIVVSVNKAAYGPFDNLIIIPVMLPSKVNIFIDEFYQQKDSFIHELTHMLDFQSLSPIKNIIYRISSRARKSTPLYFKSTHEIKGWVIHTFYNVIEESLTSKNRKVITNSNRYKILNITIEHLIEHMNLRSEQQYKGSVSMLSPKALRYREGLIRKLYSELDMELIDKIVASLLIRDNLYRKSKLKTGT